MPSDEQEGQVPVSYRVLIVDDSESLADVFVTFLKTRGHDARAVYEGRVALQAIVEYRPHVVFSDLTMPDMDGYELAEAIRKLPELKPPVLVAMSGYGRAEDKRRSLAAGFDIHLTKPLELHSLDPVFDAVRARNAS